MKVFGFQLGSNSKTQSVKSQAQLDQEAKDEAEVQAAYELAKKERRIENAKRKAVLDADKLANQKPFYQKVMGAASAIGKDLMQASSNVNPDALFTFNDYSKTRSNFKRHRKNKKKKIRYNQNRNQEEFDLF